VAHRGEQLSGNGLLNGTVLHIAQHITEKLVKESMSDLARVIVDYNMASKSGRNSIDTGKYECIYRGKSMVEKPNTMGLNLCIEGKTIKK
jgi:tubulin monoglycylase TTLL3/8